MKDIPHLELHLAHGCNLSCESCSHYSNQGHRGLVSLEDAEQWIHSWGSRVSPRIFSLLGGEPTLHPDLVEFISLSRKYWPAAHVRLVTNGFFLHRHPRLPEALRQHPNACLYLSIHHAAPEYREKIRPIIELVRGWVRDYGIRVEFYESFKNWTRRYHGSGHTMEPFQDGRPRESWAHCTARYCPQLFEGQIWKCAPLAYLKMQDAKYQLSDSWKPYLQYQPLDSHCSDEELAQFFRREEESVCGMCAATPEKFDLPIPLTFSRTRPTARAEVHK